MSQLPAFVDLPAGIDSALLREVFAEDFAVRAPLHAIGDVHADHSEGVLSFLSDSSLVDAVNANRHLAAVFCLAQEATALRSDIQPLVVTDPKFYFFTLMDFLARNYHGAFATRVGDGCQISPQANVSRQSVIVGNNVHIEPGAYIAPGTIIDDGVLIRANATVGVDGFQHQHTSRGIVSPYHDGWLVIGAGTEVGYSSSISRGFSYRPTRIGPDVKIDALAYIAHGASIGAGTILCAHTAIMGHVAMGERCWIGPNSVVSSRLRIGRDVKISLGSVVTTNVPDGARYSGNFAMPHAQFIADLKQRSGRG